jgi:hypothetical protein
MKLIDRRVRVVGERRGRPHKRGERRLIAPGPTAAVTPQEADANGSWFGPLPRAPRRTDAVA